MQRGVLGARNLNHELQRVLNPNPPATVERFGWRFSPGDRVMETQNDYDREVFNGDLGTVARIDEDEGAVVVDFEGREVVYPYRRVGHLGAGVCDHDPQEPGVGVPGCGDPGCDAALHHAGPQSPLHGRDAGQAAGGAGRPEEGRGHCGAGREHEAALDQVAGVAGQPVLLRITPLQPTYAPMRTGEVDPCAKPVVAGHAGGGDRG